MTELSETKNIDEKAISGAQLGQAIDEMTKTFLSPAVAGEMSEKALGLIKKYPLHSAMVAGGVGFLLGSFLARK